MNDQEEFWAGRFGDEYTQRNRVMWHDRASFWAWILDATKARSILEIGCNAGWNLRAIRHIAPDAMTEGCDINDQAIAEATGHYCGCILKMTALEAGSFYRTNQKDIAFTAGVLIHVGPDEIEATMRAVMACSKRYVLAVEYDSPQEEQVLYRGHTERLWKRPYGKLYEELGMKLVMPPFQAAGFDRCTAWLMEKN